MVNNAALELEVQQRGSGGRRSTAGVSRTQIAQCSIKLMNTRIVGARLRWIELASISSRRRHRLCDRIFAVGSATPAIDVAREPLTLPSTRSPQPAAVTVKVHCDFASHTSSRLQLLATATPTQTPRLLDYLNNALARTERFFF